MQSIDKQPTQQPFNKIKKKKKENMTRTAMNLTRLLVPLQAGYSYTCVFRVYESVKRSVVCMYECGFE